jgi:hypothetical protein
MGKGKDRKKGKGGRPSLLTPEITQKICSFIMAGAYDYSAAEASGISVNTFREWLSRGDGRDRERPPDKRFATFATSIRLAKANARVAAEIKIKTINPKWWLSRMYRADWSESPKQQLEVTGKGGAPVGLTLEMVRQFLDATDKEDEKP